MTANKKLGGILIENVITEGRISASVIGIGLNVNQETFEGLPNATSLKFAAGRAFELDSLLVQLTDAIEAALKDLRDQRAEEVMTNYKKHLFRKDMPSTFRLPDQSLFTGIIDDVRLNGRLVVRTEDEAVREFDIKEIQLCL